MPGAPAGLLQERTATVAGGLRLPYAETGTSGDAPVVVLVHAYVESWRYFEPVLLALPSTVHAVAPTLRGHPSVGGVPVGYRVGDFAADVVGFLDALGIARAVLVGASSGGLVCQVVATRHPDRVAGLVLISSPVTLADKPAAAALGEQIEALRDPVARGFVEDFVRGTSPDALSDDRVAWLVDESLAVPAAVWRESFRGLVSMEPAPLEDVRAPTLLLTGAEDAFVGDDQHQLLARIPDAELVVYDGVGHGPHLAHPRRVASDLAAFAHGRRVVDH